MCRSTILKHCIAFKHGLPLLVSLDILMSVDRWLDDVIEYPEFVETDPLIPNTEDFRGLQKMVEIHGNPRWKFYGNRAGFRFFDTLTGGWPDCSWEYLASPKLPASMAVAAMEKSHCWLRNHGPLNIVGWFIGLVMVGLWEHKKGWNSWLLRKCSNIRVDFHLNHIYHWSIPIWISLGVFCKFHLDHPWSMFQYVPSIFRKSLNNSARSPPASQPADVGSSPSCAATSVAGEDRRAGRPASPGLPSGIPRWQVEA